MSEKILNAKIESVSLCYQNDILTFYLGLKIQGGAGCCFGGYALDEYDEAERRRLPISLGLECLEHIMTTVGVKSWEDLKDKYIRVVSRGLGENIDVIGNIMEDKWFNIEELFQKAKK